MTTLTTTKLRPYQENGVQRMLEIDTVFLFDEMGIGKTVQALETVQRGNLFPCLIVPPKFLVLNWYHEIIKFWPDEEPVRFTNASEFINEFMNRTLMGNARFFIAWHNNLAATKNNTEIKFALDLPWKSVVVDEAHLFRNESTKKAKGLMAFKLHEAKKIFLTGTPTVNDDSDLDPLMIAGGYPVPPKDQRKHMGRNWRRRMIGVNWIRRTKNQVLKDLPTKTLSDLPLEMGEEQRAKYEQLLTLLMLEMRDGNSVSIPTSPGWVLAMLMRMRQITLDPELLDVDSPSVKTEATLEMIAEHIQGETDGRPNKVVVYTNFESYIPILQHHLTGKGIRSVVISGKENMDRRRASEQRFQTDPNTRVILVTMAAGGMGINLTEANLAIVVDEWWNSMRMQQAIDRSHRIGQTRPLSAVTLQVENSIDERIREIVIGKDIKAIDLLKGLIDHMNNRAPDVLRRMFEGIDAGDIPVPENPFKGEYEYEPTSESEFPQTGINLPDGGSLLKKLLDRTSEIRSLKIREPYVWDVRAYYWAYPRD